MWRHPAVQDNLATLEARGAHIVSPGVGWLACGVEAEGRMAEPDELLARVEEMFTNLPPERSEAEKAAGVLAGRRVMVTAGPTREPFDAIRYLSNRSTGSFGFAIARAAAAAGADVILVHGPTTTARRAPCGTSCPWKPPRRWPRPSAPTWTAAIC